jgi:hypothetical protein
MAVGVAREILKDIEDARVDKAGGKATLANVCSNVVSHVYANVCRAVLQTLVVHWLDSDCPRKLFASQARRKASLDEISQEESCESRLQVVEPLVRLSRALPDGIGPMIHPTMNLTRKVFLI